jgi:hypothetical protein
VCEVLGVGRHDHIATTRGAHHDERVHDVMGPRLGARCTRESCVGDGDGLEHASGQKARQGGLRATTPCLREDDGWHDDPDARAKRPSVDGPRTSVSAIGGDEHPGVVREAVRSGVISG